MNYEQFKYIMRNRNKFLASYNNAIGAGTDQTIDAVITRDPNDYLAPRADIRFVEIIATIAAVMTIIVMLPKVIQTLKSI